MNQRRCDGRTCCTFLQGGGPVSKCFGLLRHETTCGSSCKTVVNNFDFQHEGQCVNGECVEV